MKISAPLACAALGAALLLSSCVAPYPYYAGPGQATGTVLGAAAGGVAGALIGNNNCNPVGGALLGATLGGLAGSAIGYADDRYRYGYPPPAPYYRAPAYYPPAYGYGYGGGYPYYAAPSVAFAYSGGGRCYYPRGRCY